ncbi:hypothetical protein PNEG_01446 [Pneumocystis murina B123]|uniref:Nucleoporin NSP1 n=1 Tax=Pneumocystis murina (strain B123) TaxID=1069680 RepID=M7NSC7_PNEMU|nr:hypothetical protein PNEG_01446 [Pneumocystis murina B123]EMR10172.1 hypothetical protein PNEG_01446 [Pneumocystis murina B123]
MTSEFCFKNVLDKNSSQSAINTGDSSGKITSTNTPATPVAPLSLTSTAFKFGDSTTPAGQPPAHPLGKVGGNDGRTLENKGFQLGTSGTIFGTVADSMTSSSSTPFVFGSGIPQLDSKSAAQNKTTSFTFGSLSEKNTQTSQEKPIESTQPFSFGASTTSSTILESGATTKTEVPTVSVEKSSVPSNNLKPTATFSFGNSSTQQNFLKPSSFSVQKPQEPKPTFTFGATSTAGAKTTSVDAKGSEEPKLSFTTDTSASTTSTLFNPPTSVSSNIPSFGTKDSSQTSIKPSSETVSSTSATFTVPKTLSGTSTQEIGGSNLKNKTLKDIINKWTRDLDNYSRQFIQQATEVSKWDRLLIESGDKISKLYADTIEAEQTQSKIDQTLTYIESQQNEMSAFLDQYESQVQELSERQFCRPDGMQPADQEREKVYTLAEKLTEKLDGLGRNLGSMIDEINAASNLINKTSEDDPLSSIVKILNSHLSSLQWIQSTTTKLHYKIDEVKKAEHSIEKQLEENAFYDGQNIGFS